MTLALALALVLLTRTAGICLCSAASFVSVLVSVLVSVSVSWRLGCFSSMDGLAPFLFTFTTFILTRLCFVMERCVLFVFVFVFVFALLCCCVVVSWLFVRFSTCILFCMAWCHQARVGQGYVS